MADLVSDGTSLTLAMSRIERLEGLRGDLHAPLAAVSVVRTVEDPWAELRGMRAPGTGLPGIIALLPTAAPPMRIVFRMSSSFTDFCQATSL